MKKYLITGGTGFIGAHLVEKLLKEGNKVIVLDDLSTGVKENLNFFTHLLEFVQGSILDYKLLNQLCEDLEGIFHLAAVTSVQKSIKEAFISHQVNTLGTLNVLEAVKNKRIKLVYASSAAYYGNSEGLPCKENSLPMPLSPYAAQKILGENYCRAYHNIYGLPCMVLRFFNVYGPKQTIHSGYAGVIKTFMEGIKNQKPLIINGDGNQTRDFIYVDDVVRACILAMKSHLNFGIYNVGTGQETSIRQIADLILKLSNSNLKIEYTSENLLGDVLKSRACIQKTEKELNFKSCVGIEEGLYNTLKSSGL